MFPGRNAAGLHIDLPQGSIEIVGVARDIEGERPLLYLLGYESLRDGLLLARVSGRAEQAAGAIAAAIHGVDPELPAAPRTLEASLDAAAADLWMLVTLIGVLGAVAVLLAVAGVYGSVQFAVNRRGRELGIRVALGAQRADILREVLLAGGKPVVYGMLGGVWLSMPLAAALSRSLPLNTSDPVVYLAAAGLLLTAALLAMWGPARHGSQSDPLAAIRE